MAERKSIKLYGRIIDQLRGYVMLGMPLLSDEQALLSRAIKQLSVYRSAQAEMYVRTAERLLAQQNNY